MSGAPSSPATATRGARAAAMPVHAQRLREALASLPIGRHFNADEVETFYASAYELAETGRYQTALDRACLAMVFKPGEPRYIRAVAHLLRRLDRDAEAMTFYRVLDAIEPCSPRNVLAMAEAALHMKHTELGSQLLGQLVAHGEAQGLDGPELDRARGLLQLLSKPEQADAGRC